MIDSDLVVLPSDDVRTASERPGVGVLRPQRGRRRLPRALRTPTPRRTRVAVVAIVVVGLLLAFLTSRYTVDDAFITWRYGATLVRHGVWNWNGSGPREEAYTNPLFAVLSIVPALLHIPAELFFKLVGLAALVLYLLWLRRLPALSTGQRLWLVALAVGNVTFGLHLWSGLETGVFALLVVAVFGRLYVHGDLGRAGYLLAFLLALTRPEGVAVGAAAVGWCWLASRERHRLVAGAGWCGVVAAYWAARWAYFGVPFPNTFYVKTLTAHQGTTGALVRYVALIVAVLVAAGVVSAIVAVLAARTGRSWRRMPGTVEDAPVSRLVDATPVVLAAVVLLIVLVVYRHSTLTMNIFDRFGWQLEWPAAIVCLLRPLRTTPRLPVAGALPLLTGALLTDQTQTSPWPARVAVVATVLAAGILLAGPARAATAGLLVAVLGVVVATSWTPPGPLIASAAAYRTHLGTTHGGIGRILAASPATRRVLVMNDAGLAPMTADWYTVDQNALTSHRIAVHGIYQTDLRALRPTVVVTTSREPDRQVNRYRRDPNVSSVNYFVQTPGNGYTLVASLQTSVGYYELVWANAGLPKATRRQLVELGASSRVRDADLSPLQNLRRFLWDLPYLHGGPS